MNIINRRVLIVRAKQPFADWGDDVFNDNPSFTLDDYRCSPFAILVEKKDGLGDLSKLLKQNWEAIFEEILSDWWMDDDAWPENRTIEMFKEWFEVEMVHAIHDFDNSGIDYE